MESPNKTSGQRRTWKGKSILKKGDTIMKGGKDTDVVIPQLQTVAAGPSIGHDLKSHTQVIAHFIITHPKYPERRLIFVDTPGFDDTYIDDSEILRRIAVWLAKSYSDHMKLAGVIYLHEISQPRMMGAPRRNLEMFRELCGEDAVKNVVLGTTKWDDVTPEIGNKREEQLREKYWGHMLTLGSKMSRVENNKEAVWKVIDHILNNQPVDALVIQEELVDHRRIIPETAAGRALRATLQELLETQEKATAQLKATDKTSRQMLEESKNKIRSISQQIGALKIPLSRRITAFFSKKYVSKSSFLQANSTY
ncbi:hypothetical protein H0H81_011213 [Sphagnurus paluster]|uniref:G domain-containing protein n=1 Tax=Sphagnurus paluster TaxID=117069 RepID=A0A9P7FWW4_9AGAR|nr:hypothetical protein H0H81_011213 [Sphagnurus paluster]